MEENKNYWFVVMSKPNQEVKAIKNLKNQNFDVFSPYFEKEQSNGKITKIVKEFLFPSYIFVKFNSELPSDFKKVLNLLKDLAN